jgi:hypothetical protein
VWDDLAEEETNRVRLGQRGRNERIARWMEELEGRQKRDLQAVCVTSRRRLRHWSAESLSSEGPSVKDLRDCNITVNRRMDYTGMEFVPYCAMTTWSGASVMVYAVVMRPSIDCDSPGSGQEMPYYASHRSKNTTRLKTALPKCCSL